MYKRQATHKSNNTGEVTAIGEALAWIHQQPTDPAICYDICSDSYYGIDEVDVMPGRDSSRIRNGRLIQWAYDLLALSRGAGSIVQFRKVKAHLFDNSRDSRRNRDADKLADQGRLMDLTEFSLRLDEDETAAQLFRYPKDWDDVSDSPASASCQDHAPHLPPGPEEHCASTTVYNHPVAPMLTATQYDYTHPVPPSMCFYPVPCNDNHPNLTSRPQSAPLRTWARVSRPEPPCGSTSHSASRDLPPQPDPGACAPGSGERPGLPPTTRVPPDPAQHCLQMGLTAPDDEADKSGTGTACDRLGSPDPDRPATHDTKNRVRAVTWADRVHPDNTHTGPVRNRRDGADRVGPDRTGVPSITASQKEPTAEVCLALTPGSDGAGTDRPALDPSVFGRPEIAGHPGSPPALPPTASGPHRRRGQRRYTTRTGRKWTEREAGDRVGPGRSQAVSYTHLTLPTIYSV